MVTREIVTTDILELLTQLAYDWDYEMEITPDIYLFSELGFQSLDAVILGNSLQEKYGRVIPYGDLLTDIGQRELMDITVGEWIDFTHTHLQKPLSWSTP